MTVDTTSISKQKFEIHITGDKSILVELDSLNLKNIVVDLLTPDGELLRTEYMSSFVHEAKNFEECLNYVDKLTNNFKTEIIRTKIECPPYEQYKPYALYAESHFKPSGVEYPISRNQRSGKLIGTDREYMNERFDEFFEKWKDEDIELCLFDSFVREDLDWFKLYKK